MKLNADQLDVSLLKTEWCISSIKVPINF